MSKKRKKIGKNAGYVYIPKEELYELYVVQKKTLKYIAAKYFVTHPTIINRLKEYKLYKRENKKRKER